MKVILVMAMTLDGKIARQSTEPVDWTGKADKKKFVQITKKAGAVIMGSTTFDTIGFMLPGRKNIVMTRNSSRLASSSDYNESADNKNPLTHCDGEHSPNNIGTLVFTDKAPKEILTSLENEGFESVALIGGSVINGLFAKEDLIDEIYITIAPKLFGQGLDLFSSDIDINLELSDMEKIDNNSILLKYNVIKPNI